MNFFFSIFFAFQLEKLSKHFILLDRETTKWFIYRLKIDLYVILVRIVFYSWRARDNDDLTTCCTLGNPTDTWLHIRRWHFVSLWDFREEYTYMGTCLFLMMNELYLALSSVCIYTCDCLLLLFFHCCGCLAGNSRRLSCQKVHYEFNLFIWYNYNYYFV